MAEPTLFTIWCHFFSAFLLIGACNVFFFCGVTFPLNCSPWTCQIREYLCKTNESMIQTSIIGGKQFVVLTFRLSWHSRFWLENISVEVFFSFRLYLCLKKISIGCVVWFVYMSMIRLISSFQEITHWLMTFDWYVRFVLATDLYLSLFTSRTTRSEWKEQRKKTHTLVPIPFNNTLWPRLSRSRQIFHRWLSYKLSESNVKRTNTSLHNAQFAS